MSTVVAEPRRPMARVAQFLGCTEGQAYTALLAVTVAATSALAALPPLDADRGRGRAPVSAVARAGARESAAPRPPASTDTPPVPIESPPPSPAGRRPATAPRPRASTAGPAVTTSPARAVAADDASAASATAPPAVAARGFGPAQLAARVGQPGAPDGVAVDREGRVYVATNNGTTRGGSRPSQVFRYRADGALDTELAVTGQSAARSAGLTGVAVATDGSVLVLDTSPARLLRLDLDRRTQDTIATFPDLPGADGPPEPRALAIDRAGALFVTDSGQGVIWRVGADGKADPWHVFADGETTSGPTGIAIEEGGHLLVAVSMGLQGSPGRGLVQRVEVRADGTAGRRSTVATTDVLSGPVGLTAVPGGGIVVALSAADALVLFDADGTERARLSADQVAGQAGVRLDGPTGVTMRGRSVLVTNQSPRANDASRWAVFDVPLTS